MLTAAYAISLALLALAVWWLRAKRSVRAARWSLWLGFLLALVAFKSRWLPINPVTVAALVGFFLYFMIQGIRIEKALADLAPKYGRDPPMNIEGTEVITNRKRTFSEIAFRVLGLTLGTTFFGMGLFFLVAREYSGWYRGVVVPSGMVVTGLYLLAYAVTGRSRFGRGGLVHGRPNPQ
jgi:hypothetical protein